ncbi:extracellular solute-binding protein [Qingshengfaniella alkalisoli]|uniref:Carbohydrate ABC transporter substrate-binding protein n=1 Tax=Qingshengfaniella alkalisoli TaxID=2599296 RepID=A0A5B8IU03_9RHOB|nr:ABC transporter substrate-binding protein [Qingshengfaniella alkalisoli]QDY69094.1 carbohydrate ABC transporter substrate-binding protein [Qingshengfaniella alkalisoli]
MRLYASCAALALGLAAGGAHAQSGEITVWSWNIAASSLESVIEGFNAEYPDVTVTVEDLGNQQVFDRTLAGCAAGGSGLPDVLSIENHEAEIFWAQFPDCFANLRDLGYDEESSARFPDFKRTELEVGDVAYAMPWDSGPVAMFYRRDFYDNAGVDPASIQTWDDFIAAGKQIMEANDGVTMTNADLNGDTEWFRMIANEQGCGYFSNDGESITVNQPSCVAALDVVKSLVDEGLMTAADWNEKIQNNNAGAVASQMYGGWYEGTIRSTAPEDQAGQWGVYLMPSLSADGAHAANLGGSSLAIPANSENKEAAWAYVNYALGTNDGQVTMLKSYGLVPSLLSALEDPYVQDGLPFWGDQPVWETILGTLDQINPMRGTSFFGDADQIVQTVQTQYLNGGYDSAQAALDDAAKQIELVTGIPAAQ